MYRKLVASLGMVALLIIPGLASALGLGEIEIHSALNQPMDAEIELVGFDVAEIDEIKVDLASQQVFERVGIPRPYILTRLKFTPTVSAGKPIIRVSSTDTVREPFLTFLVDLRWSKGKLLREYTVLLDPPVFGEQARATVQKPQVTTQAPKTPKITTTTASTPPKPAPRRPAPAVPKPEVSRPPVQTQSAAPSPEIADTSPPEEEEMVKIQRGDTLWSIAERFADESGVSINQMMLAIQEANPKGFGKDNINNLKSGVILRIPPAEAARKLSREQALAEVRRQWQVWQQGRQLSDSADSAINVDSAAVDSSTVEAEPVSSEESKPVPKDSAEKSDASKLSILGDDEVAEGMSGEDAQAAVQQLRKQIALLKENSESKSQQNAELTDRIQSLESMLKKQEGIISLQNEQLAQLQNSVLSAQESEASAEVSAVADEAASADQPVESEAAEQPSDLMAEAEVAVDAAGAIMQPKVEPLPDFSGPIPEEFLAAASQAEQAAVEEPAVEEVPAEVVEEAVVEEVAAKPSFLDSIMGFAQEQSKVLIGVGAALIVGLLVMLGLRRRRDSSQTGLVEAKGLPVFDEEESADDLMEDTVVATPDSVDQALDELEEVDDAHVAGMVETQQTDSDEILEEADVYISYGLSQQAEDLLKEAIGKEPGNIDYQAKLAEVYYGDKREDEFVAYVESVEPTLDKQSSAWSKIVTMGAALVPAHALFADSAAVSGDAEFAAGQETETISEAELSEDMDADLVIEDDEIADESLEDNPLDFTIGEESGEEEQVDFGTEEIQTVSAPTRPVALDTGLEEELEFGRMNSEDDTSILESEESEESEEPEESKDDSLESEEVSEAGLDFDANLVEDELTGTHSSDTEMLDDASMDLDVDEDLTDSLDMDSLADAAGSMIEPDLDVGSDFDEDVLSDEEDGGETAIFDSSMFESESADDGANEEDTVSLEEVQENLTAELETLSFEGDDIDPDDFEEASLPTMQTEELSKRELDDIDELSENLAASETGTFEADMLAENVTEQFDIGDIDTEMVDLGNFGDDDSLDPPSVIEEVGTKLDLAKAFVDMGDEDAAKETLTEVIEQGNMTQIQEAKDLLDKLT